MIEEEVISEVKLNLSFNLEETMTDSIQSPEGEIVYIAVHQKVDHKREEDLKKGESIKKVFVSRLLFNEKNPGVREWKNAIASINPKCIVTDELPSGQFKVKATTKFEVLMLGTDGNSLSQEEAPIFTSGSTGKAIMTIEPYIRENKRGSLNLKAIAFTELNIVEAEEGAGVQNQESMMNDLRAAYNN